MTSQATIIFNPASAAGRTGKLREKILSITRKRLGSEFSFHMTKAPLEAITIARRAVLNGSGLIIAVGGDGTINEVLNGMYENDQAINPECILGVIASGTSGGLTQSLNYPETIEKQVDLIREKSVRTIDLCKVTYTRTHSVTSERYFVNDCQVGIGGTIVKKVQRSHKILGGRIAFGWVTLGEVFRDLPKSMTVTIDRKESEKISLHGITIGNGVYMGGGMKLTPKACLDDGLLDVLFIHGQRLIRRFISFSKIYSGNHITANGFTYLQCKSISIASSVPAYVGTDGEILGILPSEIKILPGILRICSPLEKANAP